MYNLSLDITGYTEPIWTKPSCGGVTSGCRLDFRHNTHFLTLFTWNQMFLHFCVWHLHLTMQTLVKFAATVSQATVKRLPICKSTLNTVCVTGESQAQLLPSWGDQTCFELQLGRGGRQLATAHHGLALPHPSCGYHHHHTSARRTRCAAPWKYRRGKSYRKWARVNPHWFGRREDRREDVTCGWE